MEHNGYAELELVDLNYIKDPEAKKRCFQLLQKYKDCNAKHEADVGSIPGVELSIKLRRHVRPVRARYYPIPERHLEEVKRQMRELENAGHISKSKSNFCAPVVVAPKKNGEWRVCVDYRALNKITVRDEFPLPAIHRIMGRLHGSKIFSKLDFKSGYAHIKIKKADRSKTAFRVGNILYEWNVMPFGLTNAPSTFQREMQKIFGDLKNVIVYIDDVLIHTKQLMNISLCWMKF